jgi:hypothetical protein
VTTEDGAALETARAFISAIAWGEHRRVWELLAEEGRTTVLRVAATRGMDQGLATRLRDGTASADEQEEFLGDLLNGLRADLAGNDLDNVKYEMDTEDTGAGRARVKLLAPLPEPLALGGDLPVGTVELVDESGGWRVDRLVPQMSR